MMDAHGIPNYNATASASGPDVSMRGFSGRGSRGSVTIRGIRSRRAESCPRSRGVPPSDVDLARQPDRPGSGSGRSQGHRTRPRPAGAVGPIRRPGHPRGVGDRQEPAAPGDLLGPQRLGERPPALRGPGRRPDRPPVPAGIPNLDWEDIAIDDQGHLYLGDIGNNVGLLRVRTIYRLDEPDPSSPEGGDREASLPATRTVSLHAAPLEPVRRRGPGLRPGDRDHGRQVPATAARPSCSPCRSIRPPAGPRSPVPVRPIGRLPGFTEPATGADLSEDGTLLAVCSYAVTRVYRRDGPGEATPWKLLAEVAVRDAADRGGHLGRARPDPGGRGGAGVVSPARGGLAGRRIARSPAPDAKAE